MFVFCPHHILSLGRFHNTVEKVQKDNCEHLYQREQEQEMLESQCRHTSFDDQQ